MSGLIINAVAALFAASLALFVVTAMVAGPLALLERAPAVRRVARPSRR